jgi:hypothetical protein
MFDDVRFTFGVISEISFPIILYFIAYYNCKFSKSKVIPRSPIITNCGHIWLGQNSA